MTTRREFTTAEARSIGEEIGIDWTAVSLDEFRRGLSVELEHGALDPQTDVTGDDPVLTGRIALAHLKEFVRDTRRRTTPQAQRVGFVSPGPSSDVSSSSASGSL
ncbi:MAG TPA: DUF5661 family protein [Actinomycetota bacterium]|jgi:hypothetical protein|nr:DUF5661 family protein [Actinomycetota bacterium]